MKKLKPYEVDDWVNTGEKEIIETKDYWCPTQNRWVFCPGPCPNGDEHTEVRVNRDLGDVQISPSTGYKRVHWSGNRNA